MYLCQVFRAPAVSPAVCVMAAAVMGSPAHSEAVKGLELKCVSFSFFLLLSRVTGGC